MLATKNLLKILQRTKCISKLSDNHVITGKFPRHFHALIKYEPRTNLYGNDYRTIQICRNYAKGKDKKKEKGNIIFQTSKYFYCIIFQANLKLL